VKILLEKIGNTLDHIGISNDFMHRTVIAQQLRKRIDKLDYIKLKSLHSKGNSHPIEESAYRMQDNLWQLCICQRINNQNIQKAQKTTLSMNKQLTE
jgi:hypothetical protein